MKRFLLALLLIATPAFAGDRVISNPDSAGSIKIKVNKGTATYSDALTVDGTTAAVTIGPAAGADNLLNGKLGINQSTLSATLHVENSLTDNYAAGTTAVPAQELVRIRNLKAAAATNFAGIEYLAVGSDATTPQWYSGIVSGGSIGGSRFVWNSLSVFGGNYNEISSVNTGGSWTWGQTTANNATGGQYHTVNGHLWAGGTAGTGAGDKQLIIGTNTDIAASVRNGRISTATTGAALLFQNTSNDTLDTLVFYANYASDSATLHNAHGIAAANSEGGWKFGQPSYTGGGSNHYFYVPNASSSTNGYSTTQSQIGLYSGGSGGLPVLQLNNGGSSWANYIVASSTDAHGDLADLVFQVDSKTNADFATINATRKAFIFNRRTTALGSIARDGTWNIGPVGGSTLTHNLGGYIYSSASTTARPYYAGNWQSGGTWGIGPATTFADNYIAIGTATAGTAWVAGATSLTNLTIGGCYKSSTTIGTGGTVVGGTCQSDRRLKKDIESITGDLSKIAALRPVTYKWINPGQGAEGTQIGLIAQEVQAVYPELVEERADGYLAVRYGQEMTMHMIEAIKELSAQNAALNARLEAAGL